MHLLSTGPITQRLVHGISIVKYIAGLIGTLDSLGSFDLPTCQRQWQRLMQVNGDTWGWVWDPFWSITMHSYGTLLAAAAAAAADT